VANSVATTAAGDDDATVPDGSTGRGITVKRYLRFGTVSIIA
jgi:hypothetical protein